MSAHPYEPTIEDVAWAQNLVRILKDGGTWGCSWGTYKLNKKAKQIEMLLVNPKFPKRLLGDLFHKTEQTFKEVGYKVITKEDVA